MADNVAGMLAYITIIPAIIFLVTAPYNRNRFMRFHSFQMHLFLRGHDCDSLARFPQSGLRSWLIFIISAVHLSIWLGSLMIWIILLIKANQGLKWKLPSLATWRKSRPTPRTRI